MPFLSYNDDYNYQEASVAIMQRWKMTGFGFYNDLEFSSTTYSGFPNFSAALMMIFGTSPLVPRIGNAVLSTITCLIAYAIVKGYAENNRARFVCIILVALPLTISISAMQFKDTLLLFFISLSLYGSISIIKGKRIVLSVLLVVISYIGCSFGRPAVIVPMAIALIIMIIRSFYISRKQGNLILKIFSLMAIVFLLIYGYQTLNKFGFEDIDIYFDSRYHKLAEGNLQDSNVGIRNMSVAQYLGAPLYFLGGLFLPPPLLIAINDTINYAAWTVLIHYAFLPFLVIAMWECIVQRNEYATPFFLLLVYAFFRIGQANSLLSSFSPRQSMATIFIMYLLLPMYKQGKGEWEKIIIGLTLLTMFAYNIVRLLSHGMI